MTNNNFNSNDFSNGCEGLENGSEQTFDKMAESVDKANVEGVSSSIEENRFDEQTKETNSKDNTNFSLPTTLKDYLIFSRNFSLSVLIIALSFNFFLLYKLNLFIMNFLD